MYLTKYERAIVIFLTASLLLGVSVSYYKKITDKAKVTIIPSGAVEGDNLDTLIKNAKVVNINTADTAAIRNLPGIGLSLAEEIVKYRQANGLFKDVQDLNNVKGIGQKKLEAIKGYLTLE